MQVLSLTATPRQTFYAGFWDRGLAKLIDFVVVGICFLPFDLAFGTSFVVKGAGHGSPDGNLIAISFSLPVFLVFCVYSAILESSKLQATLGKRMLGILVTDLNEGRISFLRALLRSVTQWLLLIDYIPALFTSSKQALHDLAADSQVVPGTR